MLSVLDRLKKEEIPITSNDEIDGTPHHDSNLDIGPKQNSEKQTSSLTLKSLYYKTNSNLMKMSHQLHFNANSNKNQFHEIFAVPQRLITPSTFILILQII